jgi:3-oxoacyl-[acyl-carrier protein] reductase
MNKRIAIVTGVSRLKGIGKAVCVELAKNNIDIFFTYWQHYDKQMPWYASDNEPDLIQDEIREIGAKCEKIELDLNINESVDILFNEVEKRFGTASILINNATYSTQTSIDSISAQELDKHYFVNLRATTLLCAEFVRRFNSGMGGRIVNLSSGQSLSAMSNEIAYAITKGAIETLTRTLSHELAYKGITINAVNPGITDTGWIDETHEKIFRDRMPFGRIGQPIDAARLIAFLVSEQAEWVTGQIIHSEGGFIREKYC